MFLNRMAHRAWLLSRRAGVMRELAELGRSELLSPERIRALQETRLRELLVHAARRVPYYRGLLGAGGIDPAGSPWEALRTLPVLTKEILRERRRDLASEDAAARGAVENATGGSTGTPIVFLQDRDHWRRNQAAMYRGFLWTGWEIGDPIAYLWGSDVDSRNHRGLGALRDRLLGITWTNAFGVTGGSMDDLLRLLAGDPRRLLIGYASSLASLARRARSTGARVRIRAVQSSAEMLYPEARRGIEDAFGCRVFDRYGCREAGVVAHECGEAEGYHVNAENTIVETDRSGRLLLTTLGNYSMPLIRYRNEDLAVLGEGPCPCGRSLPRITRIVGRTTDIIRSPSGRSIHGEFFTHLFYGATGVREFQVRQRMLQELTILVVAGPDFTEAARDAIGRNILEHGDRAFRVRWEIVTEIPRSRSGKHRFVISDVPFPGEPGS